MFKHASGEIWNGDCLELMRNIPSGSVDMVVTSPPYDNLRTYNGSLEWSFEIFQAIAKELSRVIKEGGVIVWNVADATIKGSETGTSFRQALYFKDECGLNLHDTMIWQKPDVKPLTHNRYEQCFEYMFVLSKGKPSWNGIKDRSNVSFGRKITGTWRDENGETHVLSGVKTEKQISEFGLRHNIWLVPTAKGKRSDNHPAVFPVQLAQDHILSWSNPGDLVLDPFGGSGTTAVAAHRTGRRSICIERDLGYYLGSCGRVWKEQQA